LRVDCRFARVLVVAPEEAPLRMTKNGLVADVDGWFVVNSRESRWRDEGPLGVYCTFEGKRRFRQLGINISVLAPGQALGMYHREAAQEGFLVVAGECLLIVEGQERGLKTWDYFHCPPGTEHVIVGSGHSPAVVVAVGARGRGGVVYLECNVAARVGASVQRETRNPTEAYAEVYAELPRSHWVKYRKGWLPGD
jgi:quercetin dioxygenase-like cupin family protein